MSFFKNRSKQAIFDRMREAEFYRIVVEELSSDGKDPAAWGMALVEAQGDKDKAESEYIKIRVEMLKDLADLNQHIENQIQNDVVHSVPKTSPPTKPAFQPKAHRSYTYSYDLNSGLSRLDQASCATRANDDLSDLQDLDFPNESELRYFINSRIADGCKAYRGYVFQWDIKTGEVYLNKKKTLASVGKLSDPNMFSFQFSSIEHFKEWVNQRS